MLVCAQALAPDPGRDDLVALCAAGKEVTYRELRASATEIVAASAACIAGDDPRAPYVALLGDWNCEFVVAFAGLASAGFAVGVLDPTWSPAELAGAIAQLDPCAVAVADDRRGVLAALGSEWLDAGTFGGSWTVLGRAAGHAERPPPAANPDGPFYVGFTSGSAGRPKAFVRSHRSWWESFDGFRPFCDVGPGDRVLVPGPLSSSHFLFGVLHGLHAGATVELTPTAEASPVRLAARLAGDDPVAAVYAVPTMLRQLAATRVPIGNGGPGHILCAGARLEEAVLARARRRFPRSRIVEYYGASELSFVAIRVDGDGTPRGAVGRAFPGVEISIRDEGDDELGPGETGMIFARGPLTFIGYRGTAPETAARGLDGGWWTVGDRGSLDPDGFLTVAGRGTSLIITGGANVQPEEVEQVIDAIDGVAACVVVGVPDETWGEIVCAAVLPEPDVRLHRSDLRGVAATALAPYKRPRRYVALDGPVPLSRAGKVDRERVRAIVIAAGADREIA